MKKTTIYLLALCFVFKMKAQTSTFEPLPLPATNYWNGIPGVDSNISFIDDIVRYTNDHDTSSFGDSWSGWGYSATTDTINGTWTNDMSAITGKGHNNSNIYGVAYLGYDSSMNHIKILSPRVLPGFYITNSTYAYRTIQNGNFTAKKFGGATGNDPDYFRLDIMGWLNGVPKTDTVRFYLADFRDSNNANDYIVKDWKWVSLSSLGTVDSLTYNQVSTDNNSFGMLTPSYFCMDDLALVPQGINEWNHEDIMQVYPVPMNDQLTAKNLTDKNLSIELYNLNGQIFQHGIISAQETIQLNTDQLPCGVYVIRVQHEGKYNYIKIVK